MEPLPGNPRGTRLTLVALGLFALLVIVGFASRAGFGGRSETAPSQTYLDYAFSVFLVLFVLGIPVAIYGFWLQRQESTEHTLSRRPFLQTMSIIGIFTALALIVNHLHGIHFRNPFAAAKNANQRIPTSKKHAHGAVQQVEPHFRWPVLAVAIALLLALLVAALVVRRRRRRRVPIALAAPEVRAELAAAISDAIGDLEAEPDARRAVIAAYARMERVLGRHGLPRRPSETPFEYLARVLLAMDVDAASVRRLTTLFEHAKFSPHEVDAAMKADAIAALRAIRDELEATA